jgi:hypothetical protein
MSIAALQYTVQVVKHIILPLFLPLVLESSWEFEFYLASRVNGPFAQFCESAN